MATYLPKKRGDILRNALRKIESETSIKTTTVGSVARSFTEAITTEIGDLYDILDYNITQQNISSATGRHLDNIGATYGVERSTVSNSVQISRTSGSFYFYIDSPAPVEQVIPQGTKVYTSAENFIGRQLSFSTSSQVSIPVGETRVFAGLVPDFNSNEVTAGVGTLTVSTATSATPGITIRCTNPKPIYSTVGYESDRNYRARIVKRLAVQSTGTIEAIRYALLGKSNVRDVKIYSSRLGLGVVEVVVVPQETNFTRKQVEDIRTTVDSARPTGIRTIVTSPERITADITGLIFLNKTNIVKGEEESIRARCIGAWTSYINNLLPGDRLVYNKLIDIAFDISDKIIDITITDFKVGGSSSIRGNYTPRPDQIVIAGNLDLTTSLFS